MTKVSLPSMLQASLQAMLRPAMWLPGVRNLHCHKVTWQSDRPQLDVLAALVNAVQQIKATDDTGAFYDIHKVDKDKFFLRVFCFTRAEWLDVVEIEVLKDQIEAKSFSSGLFPLIIPFAFLLNLVFFWVPFYDNKFNQNRLDLFKHYTDMAISTKRTTDSGSSGQEHVADPQVNPVNNTDTINNSDINTTPVQS